MKVLLHNKELWQKFSEHQTEMKITNSGRRMFPPLSVTFEDLKPLQFYTVMIDFVPVDEFKYSFDVSSNRWVPHWRELAEEEDSPRFYIHPWTPAMGAFLLQDGLTFKMLKLTNSPQTAAKSTQAILLSSMRRYIPRVHVVAESASGVCFDYNLRKEFYFPETEFMAVTQYRNQQIAKLKIDVNPFAKGYRNDGLHGKAKRRRIESMAAYEDWKTPESGPPSNSSSMEDFLVNSDEPDFEHDSSSELFDEPSSEGTFASNEREVNGMRQVSPCQTGLRKDVSDAHYEIQDETNNQESLSTVSQVTQNQSTNQNNEMESHLTCEESTEWMWGFDEQMQMRYAPENQLESFVGRFIPANASKNATDANEAVNDVGQATVNRRKKYLPRRLQRTCTASSTNASSVCEVNEEPTETERADKPTVNQIDLLSSQPNDATSFCGNNKETAQSPSLDTIASPASSCFEPPEKAPVICCNNSPQQQQQKINSHTDAILSKFCTTAGFISVGGQDSSHSGCSLSGETSATPANSSLSTPESRGATASSLNALIQMCSEAEGRLGRRRSVRKQGAVTRETSKKLEGMLARKDPPSGRFAEAWTSSSEESEGTVTSQGGDCLSERPVEKSTTSSRYLLSQESGCNVSVSLTSEAEARTRPSPIPTFPSSSGQATSSDITATYPVAFSTSGNDINSSSGSSSRNGVNESPTTTNRCQTGSTADTVANPYVEDPLPVIVNTFSGYYIVNGVNVAQPVENKQPGYRPIVPAPNQSVNICSDEPASDASVSSSCSSNSIPYIVNAVNVAQPVENKQLGYRPIVPAPNQSVNICSDEPTSDASVSSSCCSNSIPYPIIVDSFSINENYRYAVAHRSFKYKILEALQQARCSDSDFVPSQISPPPQVNRAYFSSPNSNQTNHSGFIALDNTVLRQAFSLEKFYSFSSPENQAQALRLQPQNRYYKTTRTNFSRLSLEPICSVIHPLKSFTRQ